MAAPIDCLIVGGGPAGLTAAIYAVRFRLSAIVIDAGESRAAAIPCSHNHAGFPDGVSGLDLLARMRRQAVRFGAVIRHGRVERLVRSAGQFKAYAQAQRLSARAVILTTGVTNRRPPMPDALHAAAIAAGRLRYCPVCDGFEVTDQTLAVIGTGDHGVKEAQFLRSYSDRISLISPECTHDLTAAQRRSLGEAGIAVLEGPAADFQLSSAGLSMALDGTHVVFDAVYPALGSDNSFRPGERSGRRPLR